MTFAEDYRQLISCVDLTSLNSDDTNETILALCNKAKTPIGQVACVCIYPQFVSQAWEYLASTKIKIATVANFSSGLESIETVSETIKKAILDGASEIDVVIPYHSYKKNNRDYVKSFISQCKYLCGKNTLLKTILETGALSSDEIQMASVDAIEAGSDFLKTSTGKIEIGATLEAAKIMMTEIKNSKKPVGFKASGGIKTVEQANDYVSLCKTILGENAFHPSRFRLGASSLLDNILENANANHP